MEGRNTLEYRIDTEIYNFSFEIFLSFFFFLLSKISCFIIQINFSRTDILNVMIKLKTIIWKYNNNNDEKIRYMDDARKKKRKNDDKKNDDEIS